MDYKKWLLHEFSTGPAPGRDYIEFQRQMRLDLKKQAEANGLELHSFNKNHYCFTAVLKDKESDRFIYVSLNDVRGLKDRLYNCILIRMMEHEKDWTGGSNNWCCWNQVGVRARELVERMKKAEQKQEEVELDLER